MTDLTEQWKKGELPEGCYYMQDKWTNGINAYENYGGIRGYGRSDITKVLAKIPTYQEYIALQSDSLAKNEASEIIAELEKNVKDLKAEKSVLLTENRILNEQLKEVCKKHISLKLTEGACDDANKILHEQIKQLKELLKECRKILDYAKDFAYHQPCCKCIAKIDQALGEE